MFITETRKEKKRLGKIFPQASPCGSQAHVRQSLQGNEGGNHCRVQEVEDDTCRRVEAGDISGMAKKELPGARAHTHGRIVAQSFKEFG